MGENKHFCQLLTFQVFVHNSVNYKLPKNTERKYHIMFLNKTQNSNGYILLEKKDTSYRTHGLTTLYCVFPHKVCMPSTQIITNCKGWGIIIINALTHNMTDEMWIATKEQNILIVHTLMCIRLHFKMCP